MLKEGVVEISVPTYILTTMHTQYFWYMKLYSLCKEASYFVYQTCRLDTGRCNEDSKKKTVVITPMVLFHFRVIALD